MHFWINTYNTYSINLSLFLYKRLKCKTLFRASVYECGITELWKVFHQMGFFLAMDYRWVYKLITKLNIILQIKSELWYTYHLVFAFVEWWIQDCTLWNIIINSFHKKLLFHWIIQNNLMHLIQSLKLLIIKIVNTLQFLKPCDDFIYFGSRISFFYLFSKTSQLVVQNLIYLVVNHY